MSFVYVVAALIIVLAIARLSNAYLPMPPMMRTIMNVVLGLIVVGIVLWLINTYIPMAGAIKGLLNIVVFLAAIVGVLQAVGLWPPVVAWWRHLRSHPPTMGDHSGPAPLNR